MKSLEQVIRMFDWKNYIEEPLGGNGILALAQAIQSQIIEPLTLKEQRHKIKLCKHIHPVSTERIYCILCGGLIVNKE